MPPELWLRGGVVRNCVITYSAAQYVQGDTSYPCAVCSRSRWARVVLCALSEILLSCLIAPPRPRRCGPSPARTRSRARSQAPLIVVLKPGCVVRHNPCAGCMRWGSHAHGKLGNLRADDHVVNPDRRARAERISGLHCPRRSCSCSHASAASIGSQPTVN